MVNDRFALLSDADRARASALRRMKAIALGALIVMAVVFAISFATQEEVPAMAYVRAAAEGGMVGALADWFAVTALFRHPLGIPIPHTALIPKRKDELGRSLGEFVESNFLSSDLVADKVSHAEVTRRLAEWLGQKRNSRRVTAEAGAIGAAALRALSDDDVQDLIANLAREHLIDPDWGTPAGLWLERVVDTEAYEPVIDLAAKNLGRWLSENPGSFTGLVSSRLPSWLPSAAHRLVDAAIYNEARSFVDAVAADPHHPARDTIRNYLNRLAHDLQSDPETRRRLDDAKVTLFDSPRMKRLAQTAWESTKHGLITALEDESSALRHRIQHAVEAFAERVGADHEMQARGDRWMSTTAGFFVDRYRHDIASIITDTIDRWDPAETTQKIELLVGKDLQFIRLNGTIVGALAGLVIYTAAHAFLG